MPELAILVPQPQSLTLMSGSYALQPDCFISLDSSELLFSAKQLKRALLTYASQVWQIAVGDALPPAKQGLRLGLSERLAADAYTLEIKPQGMEVRAGSEAGIFYAAQTLIQLLRQYRAVLPCLSIQDQPDIAQRGVMLDISRDKVPKMATLYRLVDLLSHLKMNQLQLYTEHTFAYQQHPDVWQQASPLTAEDILELDSYCRERFIELVPNQNSFGHMNRWFEHERYEHLAEAPEGFYVEWGGHRINFPAPFSLDPSNPASLDLVASLWDELLPNFSSRMVNVGLDETFDLGQGKSKTLCEEKGKDQVYLDYLLAVYEQIKNRGYTMQYWGDIISHFPELIPKLPKDAIALEWGYDFFHSFEERARAFAEAKIPFYVCPGTSSWNSLAGRTDNTLANIINAAEQGIRHDAAGFLLTDWGDNGHWQQLPISYLGYVYGAACAWALETNRGLDLAAVLDTHIVEDEAKVVGQLLYDLGNVYQQTGVLIPSSSFLFFGLVLPLDLMQREDVPDAIKQGLAAKSVWLEALQQTLVSTQELKVLLAKSDMQVDDASIITDELQLTGELLELASKRLLVILGDHSFQTDQLDQTLMTLAKRYEACWHRRNREGGLSDSLAKLIGKHDALPVPWQEALGLFLSLA